MVAPEVGRALGEKTPLPGDRPVAVRYAFDDDDYPPLRAWVLARDAVAVGERVLDLEEVARIAPHAVCAGCLDVWLRSFAAPIELDASEQRFLRLAKELTELLRPALERAIIALSDKVAGGYGFSPRRHVPFVAHARSAAGLISVEVEDAGDRLLLRVRCPEAFATPAELQRSVGENEHADIAHWGAASARFLELIRSRL